jgi:hypothetical protein
MHFFRFHVSALSVLAVALLAACGNSSDTGGSGGSGGSGGASGSGGSGGSAGGATDGGAQPPAAGPAQAPDGADVVLAIHKIYLGDTSRQGQPSTSAWKDFGYNLDGKISTSSSTDLCKTSLNASTSAVYPDGTDGIDNSFGKNILPIIEGIASDASTRINSDISAGGFTLLLDFQKLGTGTNYNPLDTLFYGGTPLVDASGARVTPKWDGTDAWPLSSALLKDGNAGSPLVTFPAAYLVKNPTTGARTWVSGSKSSITLNLTIGSATLVLSIASATLSVDLDASNTKATNGTISGVLDTEQVVTNLGRVSGALDPSACPGTATFESLANQIRQASDIMADGTQDPTKTCNGISIGLGFDMDAVKLGAVTSAVPSTTSSCN